MGLCSDAVQLVYGIESDTMQVLSFINMNLCPGGESVWEGPAIDSEANATEDGNPGVLRTPERGGKRVGGIERRRWRSHSGDWGKNGLDDVWGRRKILSGGE